MINFGPLIGAWQRFHSDLEKMGAFVEPLDLRPCLTAREINVVQKRLQRRIPKVLVDYWTTGCAGINMNYALPLNCVEARLQKQLSGVLKIIPGLTEYISGNLLFPDANIVVPPERRLHKYKLLREENFWHNRGEYLWASGIPFAKERNGNCYAVLPEDTIDNPPVYFLCVEKPEWSMMIAHDFIYFIKHMHEVRFLGLYEQLSWFDLPSGLLHTDKAPVHALHRTLPQMSEFETLVAQ